jgi:hypothetical protein
MDNRGIQVLMRNVETDQLMIALKGATDQVKDKFFGNMSERARSMFKDDMEAKGPMRITDVEGNVVFSDRANGGTITWNGRLYNGERAATGVYLIFASNDDGSQTKVAKLLFVN